ETGQSRQLSARAGVAIDGVRTTRAQGSQGPARSLGAGPSRIPPQSGSTLARAAEEDSQVTKRTKGTKRTQPTKDPHGGLTAAGAPSREKRGRPCGRGSRSRWAR